MFFEPVTIGDVMVSSGRVMRPEEVKESLADRPAVRNIVGGWYLCGDVLREMFDALVAAQGTCTMQMAVFCGGSSGNYGVFAQQVETFQHRFLLPLFEPPIIHLLESLRDEPVQLSLGRQDEDAAVLIRQRLPWSQVSEVLRFTQRVGDVRVTDVFSDGRTILDRARAVDAIASFPGMPHPSTVCVSFVLPEEALSAHEQLAGAAAVSNVIH
ncbi:hypothetical protein [Burkholderia gladioli]|uniref:hypothetical protein n=1 Tax=Burkholderia gladioli TaxID=28095 RepID=UPI00236323AF|nr:hypothetical protein [Burkholderia gladioli]MDD1790147.1 hypothetical protein [Burkholderia gladioli]